MMKKSLAVILVLGMLLILTGSILSGFAPEANAGGPDTRWRDSKPIVPPTEHPWMEPKALDHPWGDCNHDNCLAPRQGDASVVSECSKNLMRQPAFTRLLLGLYVRYTIKQEMSKASPTKYLGK